MIAAKIPTSDCDCKTEDKSSWLTMVKEGMIVADERRIKDAMERKARRKANALGSTQLVCKRFGRVLSLKDRYAQPQEEMQPNQTMMHHCLARRKHADYSI